MELAKTDYKLEISKDTDMMGERARITFSKTKFNSNSLNLSFGYFGGESIVFQYWRSYSVELSELIKFAKDCFHFLKNKGLTDEPKVELENASFHVYHFKLDEECYILKFGYYSTDIRDYGRSISMSRSEFEKLVLELYDFFQQQK